LKDTKTGDTLCDPDNPAVLEGIEVPEPVISLRVEPKTKADQEKMSLALRKLSDEDPTFRIKTDEETAETIISGMGELHLEIIVDRLKREFGVAREECIFVGDTPEDILCGMSVIETLVVMTGPYWLEHILQYPVKPQNVMPSVDYLSEWIEKNSD